MANRTRSRTAVTALAFILAIAAFLPAAETPAPQAPTGLRCEYMENPMGVDVRLPRFFWVLEHSGRGQAQSAYQMIVSSDPAAAAGEVWDSGKVASAKSTQVVYAGQGPQSGKTYFWKVRYWDKDGQGEPVERCGPLRYRAFRAVRVERAAGSAAGTSSARNSLSTGASKRARAYRLRPRLSRAPRQRPKGRGRMSSTRDGRPTTSGSST